MVRRSPTILAHVLEHLREMVIKPAYPARRPTEPIFGGPAATTRRLAKLIAAMRAAPDPVRRPAAGDAVDGAGDRGGRAAPALAGAARLRRRRRRRRLPDDAGGAGDGGAASTDESDISIARGARSKDTWVISDGAVSEFTLLRRPPSRSS